MPITFKKTVAVLEGHCAVEEAESLLGWLLDHPSGKVNLKKLVHPHTAVLQVLLALRPTVGSWPEDEEVAAWLRPALAHDD